MPFVPTLTPNSDSYEPILAPNPDRLCMFPIKYPSIWEFYKKAQASLWTAEEIDLSHDMVHLEQSLTLGERHFISHVLAYFTSSDGIALENVRWYCAREPCYSIHVGCANPRSSCLSWVSDYH
ncbi:ribonucleoside-diphosphate reductase R2 [Carex littledalei]|uniref:Ribonucleoside-diphosphate reductase R2 n=1 Tax=Carex littledalei TaxID=544730 RepID=A0A833V325_9POAL|nr:ribonucleoside-diphosphate reductase R2 [Carex littledalei]